MSTLYYKFIKRRTEERLCEMGADAAYYSPNRAEVLSFNTYTLLRDIQEAFEYTTMRDAKPYIGIIEVLRDDN